MKMMRYLVALTAAAIAVLSCNKIKEPVDQGNTPAPAIQLAVSEVELASDGAAVDVAYMVENPVDGQKISVSNNSGWLTVSTAKARVLTFSAGLNETGAVRETQVVISYEGAEDVTIDVTQGFFVSPLKITISDVTAPGVIFSVTTSDPEMTWIPMVTYKESFEYFDTADELFKNDLEYFDYLADIRDMTRSEFLEMMTAQGSLENVNLDGLNPSTDFVLYAYGITLEGRRTTDIVSMQFRTEDPYEGDITFTFEAEEDDFILNYSVYPSHTGVPYFYGVATKDEVELWKSKYSNNLREAIQTEVIDKEIDELLELEFIKGPEDYFAIYNESNVVDWGYYELKASTTYVLYAVKWDQQCVLTGPVSTYEHTSQSVGNSDNQITLEVTGVTQSSADATATVTTDDPYVIMPVRTSEIAGFTDEEIFVYVTEKYDYIVSEYTYTGNHAKTYSRMRPDTEYTMLAFGYKAGTMTTSEMDKVTFKTLPAGDPMDCTFEFNVQPDVDFAFVEVTPSDKGQFYKWMVCPPSYTADEVKYFIDQLIEVYYEGDYATFSSWELALGNDSANVWDLYESTEYKVAAVVMDYDTGEYLSDVVFSDTFTTLAKVYADLEFVMDYGPYYDLGELISAGQTQLNDMLMYGDAIFPVKVKVNGKCSAFYYEIYQNDLTDVDTYPDETFYARLQYEGCTRESSTTAVKYNQYMTFVAMAYDYDGNVTRLYRDLLFFTPEGVSPAEDFIASIKKAPTTMKAASSSEPVQVKAVNRELPKNLISPADLQAKHEAAMSKVNDMRRVRYMKEIHEAKLRKEKKIAK